MEGIVFWLVLVIIAMVIEAATVNLGTLSIAVGGLGAIGATLFGAGMWIQWFVFLVVTLIALIFVRPLAKKALKGKVVQTNAARVIGMDGIVVAKVEDFHPGLVKADGKEWTAITKGEGVILEIGELVKVLGIEGVKLVVEKKEEMKND